jgi:hypothetical protein
LHVGEIAEQQRPETKAHQRADKQADLLERLGASKYEIEHRDCLWVGRLPRSG